MLTKIPSKAIKELANWQLFTLVCDEKVLLIFLDYYNYGCPHSGNKCASATHAFYKSVSAHKLAKKMLRKRYERLKRLQATLNSEDPGRGEEAQGCDREAVHTSEPES